MTPPIACIVGAASGIGRATAELLHRRGYELVLSDLSAVALGSVCAATNARATPLDMSDRDAVSLFAATLPKLDALIITAGLSPSMADFERILAINLTATAATVEELGERLKKGGTAICIGSMTAPTAPVEDSRIIALLDEPARPDLASALVAILGPATALPGMGSALSSEERRVGKRWSGTCR